MSLYRIAGYLIEVKDNDSLSKLKSPDVIPGFSSFFTNREKTDEKPLLRFDTGVALGNRTVKPQYQFEFTGITHAFSKDGNVYLFRMELPDNIHPRLVEIHREDDIFHAYGNLNNSDSDYVFRFAVLVAFGVAALSRQTVPVHASAVMYKDKSVLFLGESGTGKSTHARLWLKHITDTELLNDDCPFVCVEADGNIQVCGSPWSGKTPCYKNKHTPVAAFVRLSQAPYNCIRRLTGINAIGAMLPSCPLTFTSDKQLSESIYSILSQVLQHTPVYYLECLPDVAAAKMVFDTLKRDNIFNI